MTSSSRYADALLWAEQLHRDQRRKGKPIPYISHLIAVSALVWEDGGTEDQAIANIMREEARRKRLERRQRAKARRSSDRNYRPGGVRHAEE